MIPQKSELRLLVLESDKQINRSICLLPYEIIKELGLANGDLVELEGQRKTGAITFPSVKDKGSRNIRLDEILRINTRTSVGQELTIRALNPVPARIVVVTPVEKNRKFHIGRLAFVNRPVCEGDIISIHGSGERVQDSSNLDPFRNLRILRPFQGPNNENLENIRVSVEFTDPSGIVLVSGETIVKII